MLSQDCIEEIMNYTYQNSASYDYGLTDKQIKIFEKKIERYESVNSQNKYLILLYACIFYIDMRQHFAENKYPILIRDFYSSMDYVIKRAICCVTGQEIEHTNYLFTKKIEAEYTRITEEIDRIKNKSAYAKSC